MNDNPLWVEKYRPRTIADTILPENLKKTFQTFVDEQKIPNLILCGEAGTGKTTVAKAMCNMLDCDYLVINGSMNGGIDTLRTEIQQFSSTVSFDGNRKYVILDEADYLTANTQAALRNFMEEFSKNCGFILTCNFKNKIISPLHSRCAVIDFKLRNQDKAEMAKQLLVRVQEILTAENIEYDKKVLIEIIKKYIPDNRRVLNELQRYSVVGKIDSGILINMETITIKKLVDFMKQKNYTEVRKWVGTNSENDTNIILRTFYDNAVEYFQPRSIPQLVILLAEYQYKAAFVADPEINLASCFAEIMVNCEFK